MHPNEISVRIAFQRTEGTKTSVDDLHFHPIEPRDFRVYAIWKF